MDHLYDISMKTLHDALDQVMATSPILPSASGNEYNDRG